ncbi:NAD(+) synthase [Crocinitomix catalasitica]|nr:NAD(+) synthase [Crocinitomix catalasitica]
MNHSGVIQHIVSWLRDYCANADTKGFVVGVSGGIDSAVTSTLCAMTDLKVVCVEMGIQQNPNEVNRGLDHISWLENKFSTLAHERINLTETFESFRSALSDDAKDHGLGMANSRARLRMCTLYAIAQANSLLVAGTGNKVEDFGVGFYTKYGDGGVDLSPIADLMKSEVYALAKELEIIESIQNAEPTDGLWKDSRTDEGQLGATYPELEWAMEFVGDEADLSDRQKQVLEIYRSFHNAAKHKMMPIPVCIIPEDLKT